MEVFLRDELLDGVNGDGAIDIATGAGVFAALIANASADGWEWVGFLNESQGFGVLAFVGFL